HPIHPHLIVCEFERENDPEYPLHPPDHTPPGQPENTLFHNYTPEELAESTEVSSKPLRLPQRMRTGRSESNAMQIFDLMNQVQDQLAEASTLDKFLKVLVGIVKELTGYHRVMIYQFDASYNGKVVTELVDTS